MLQNDHDTERKVISILKVLSESSEPMGSINIARELESHGIHLSERAVRYHLKITDERGFTRALGRDGRSITAAGVEELKSALAPDQVGFVIDRIALMAFLTTFDPIQKTGQVAINTSLFAKDRFEQALAAMKDAFAAGLCVSDLVAVAGEGEKLGNVVIPQGHVGLATVCSATINGVLLKAGVPMDSKFGGILEMRGFVPRRFVAIISYAGSSLDPSEAYIRARMTQVRRAAAEGNGRILANFRETPSACRPIVEKIGAQLREVGIGGILMMGESSEPVCQIPVGLNKNGMVLLGGMNPIAAAEEAGIEAENVSESGTIDFRHLVRIRDV
ncbi:MAG TPA: NrpR regulatory domain-containing protein [Dehalococcoidia bacterium]|nr:NrpR regulatory domain-containing protein [Dehalococcoidia bacterium]